MRQDAEFFATDDNTNCATSAEGSVDAIYFFVLKSSTGELQPAFANAM
jgi:hypothetical protein